MKTPCKTLRACRVFVYVFMRCSVYFARELLLRLLYTPALIAPAADTASKANHKARLLLSPVEAVLSRVLLFGLLSVRLVGMLVE